MEDKTIRDAKLEGRIAIDIGANYGDYSRMMAARALKVLSVEPHPTNIALFKERSKAFKNIELFEGVIASENGERKLFTCASNDGGHSISQKVADERKWNHDPDKFITVRSWRLDTLADGLDVAVIKIDVEGAEEEVLRSGERMLRACRPDIALETHQTINDGAIEEFLKGLGYRIIGNSGECPIKMDGHYQCLAR